MKSDLEQHAEDPAERAEHGRVESLVKRAEAPAVSSSQDFQQTSISILIFQYFLQ